MKVHKSQHNYLINDNDNDDDNNVMMCDPTPATTATTGVLFRDNDNNNDSTIIDNNSNKEENNDVDIIIMNEGTTALTTTTTTTSLTATPTSILSNTEQQQPSAALLSSWNNDNNVLKDNNGVIIDEEEDDDDDDFIVFTSDDDNNNNNDHYNDHHNRQLDTDNDDNDDDNDEYNHDNNNWNYNNSESALTTTTTANSTMRYRNNIDNNNNNNKNSDKTLLRSHKTAATTSTSTAMTGYLSHANSNHIQQLPNVVGGGVGPTSARRNSLSSIEMHISNLTKQERIQKRQMKLFILLVLGMSFIGAIIVYYSTTNAEEIKFNNAFHDQSIKLLEGLYISLHISLGTLDTLAMWIITTVRITNQTFPYVTIPEYGIHAAKTKPFTGAVCTNFIPIIQLNERLLWENYSSSNNNYLNTNVIETFQYQNTYEQYYGPIQTTFNSTNAKNHIYSDFEDPIPYYNTSRPDNHLNIYLPGWQSFPLIINTYAPANYDWYSMTYNDGITDVIIKQKPIISKPFMIPNPNNLKEIQESLIWCEYYKDFIPLTENCMEPMSYYYYPVIGNTNNTRQYYIDTSQSPSYQNSTTQVEAMIIVEFYWKHLLKDILPYGIGNIILVVDNECNTSSFTYQINGPNATYLGVGDIHDSRYNNMVVTTSMFELELLHNRTGNNNNKYTSLPLNYDHCPFTFHIYPTTEMESNFQSNSGIIYAISAALFIIIPFLLFTIYDYKASYRQNQIIISAKHSAAIVSSLFPDKFIEKLYPISTITTTTAIPTLNNNNHNNNNNQFELDNNSLEFGVSSNHTTTISGGNNTTNTTPFGLGMGYRMMRRNSSIGYGSETSEHQHNHQNQVVSRLGFPIANNNEPMAEFYPDTTVLFADIADFTSWSSVRDPGQVFTLLESIYGVFDNLAEEYNVFKVETVGDSYIAVTGLPEPRSDHPVVMCQFGAEMLNKMSVVTLQLSTTLGPDTSHLTLRIGINSGPTTAGVLRSTKCRFQLFGDTVNTAARMESNGRPGRIMCSQKTADLLISAGYEHWLCPRSELVAVKGKGDMQCYWCNPNADDTNSRSIERRRSVSIESRKESSPSPKRQDQMIQWVADMLQGLLKHVMATRLLNDLKSQQGNDTMLVSKMVFASPRDEVSETITIPRVIDDETKHETIHNDLPTIVSSQLLEYITTIAAWYRKNPFHNFEHASHVVMASKKLLKRVVKPIETHSSATAYGITSDPLTQFAILFAALIHDVDHPGVSNAQLVKESAPVAVMYHDKSVAEQNSVTISWDLLMQPQFNDLRTAIMPNTDECKRFRQLLVNAVLATDLFDAELKSLRENRWKKAFDSNDTENQSVTSLSSADAIDDHTNRRATIVIEHIIQAADVSHTMQHWHIYQKWNQRLLEEMYAAYANGRSEKDPSTNWYQGELWFFDNYIIPLAMKLKTCGVFGVSCDELLDYATANRAEWALKGEEIVLNSINNVKTN